MEYLEFLGFVYFKVRGFVFVYYAPIDAGQYLLYNVLRMGFVFRYMVGLLVGARIGQGGLCSSAFDGVGL